MKCYALFYTDDADVKQLYAIFSTVEQALKEMIIVITDENIDNSDVDFDKMEKDIEKTIKDKNAEKTIYFYGYYIYNFNNKPYIIEETTLYND